MKLDGNKTWLGLIVAFLPSVVADIHQALETPGGKFEKALAVAGKALVIIGAAHKIIKGQ